MWKNHCNRRDCGGGVCTLAEKWRSGVCAQGETMGKQGRREVILSEGVWSDDGPIASTSRGLMRGARRRYEEKTVPKTGEFWSFPIANGGRGSYNPRPASVNVCFPRRTVWQVIRRGSRPTDWRVVRKESMGNTGSDGLKARMQQVAARVEQELLRCLELDRDCPDRLREAMQYSLFAGGKRLRPALVVFACEACGGTENDALQAACAVEMVHTYSLIHDDLPAMDDDDFRRGRPTNHKVFGEAMAILAGDGLLTLAFEVLSRIQPGELAAACCQDLAVGAGARGMVGGQVVDLAAEESPLGRVEELEAIHERKTGRLIQSSLLMGGRIGGGGPQSLRTLQRYGRCIGLAFQIADDLLDEIGDPEKMGKGTRKDAALGKWTYPRILGVEASRTRAEQLVNEATECVREFGQKGAMLEALARYVIERDR